MRHAWSTWNVRPQESTSGPPVLQIHWFPPHKSFMQQSLPPRCSDTLERDNLLPWVDFEAWCGGTWLASIEHAILTRASRRYHDIFSSTESIAALLRMWFWRKVFLAKCNYWWQNGLRGSKGESNVFDFILAVLPHGPFDSFCLKFNLQSEVLKVSLTTSLSIELAKLISPIAMNWVTSALYKVLVAFLFTQNLVNSAEFPVLVAFLCTQNLVNSAILSVLVAFRCILLLTTKYYTALQSANRAGTWTAFAVSFLNELLPITNKKKWKQQQGYEAIP